MNKLPDLAELWKIWPLSGPWRFRSLSAGANNPVLIVDTPSSGSYLLKIFQAHRDLHQIQYEIAVLEALQKVALPFAVAVPIPALSGEKLVRLEAEDNSVLVSLFPLLEGTHPLPDDLAQAYSAGEALAGLDLALTQIQPESKNEISSFPSYAELCQPDPWIPDLEAAFKQLALDSPGRTRIINLWGQVVANIPGLYGELSVQIIHADYDRSNILMEGHRVTAVLDFEFSGPDLRAMELAVMLSWWPDGLFGGGREWAVIEALGQGYTSVQPLLAPEIEALPLLLQLRAIASLIHRLKRYQRGLDPEKAVLDRARDVLRREDWLERNRTNLFKAIQTWKSL